MVKVVYFNQWVSSITDVIADLKKRNKDSIKVIASSKNKDHAYKFVVDEFIEEDWEETGKTQEDKNTYIAYILSICKKYKVDIFFVKKHADWIADRANDFALNHVFLINETKELLEEVSRKSRVYDALLSFKEFSHIECIPHYMSNMKRSELQYIKNTMELGNWCFKLDNDEGGASFRRVTTTNIDMHSLGHFRTNEMSIREFNDFADSLSDEDISKLIFMEVLDSPEISVDCYESKQGFISICRCKLPGTRKEVIFYNNEISSLCKNICSIYKFKFPFNVQFRLKHGCTDYKDVKNLRLLEINPRMSGGIYYEVAVGLNIAEICLRDVMNVPERYSIKNFELKEDIFVTHVERAIILNNKEEN